MKLGLLLGSLQDARSIGALGATAERLGFDSLWAGDHIAFPAPILDPLAALACYAAHTETITLGTCVYLLPLRHPTPVAKMVASLDFLSQGRVIFGVGVGGEFPGEFQASGVPVRERGGRTNEAIGVLRSLWRGMDARHEGRFFCLDPVRLLPPPARPGGPPIWIGGRSEAALRRTARLGDGYVGYLLSPDGFRERMDKIRAEARAEKSERPITAALMVFSLIDSDREAAARKAAQFLGAMYGRPMESAVAKYCLVGSDEDCGEAVGRYKTAGVEHLILSPLGFGGELEEQVRRIAAALLR
jgi:probable F420-dependent oxidoreductase